MAIQERIRRISFPRVDYVLLSIVAALLIIGLIMIWSITFAPNVGEGSPDPQIDFVKQAGFALVGLVLVFVLMLVDYTVWGRLALPLMVGTVIVLILLLLMPSVSSVNGARRWLFEGSIQPSEVAKFTVIVYMAKWLSSKGDKLRQVTYGLLPFAIFVGGITGLIVLQPNLSTAIIIALCAMAMFFIAGADVIQYFFLLIAGGITIALVIKNTPYMFTRFMIYTQDPFASAATGSYQVAETLIALGSGGLVGRGLGTGYAKFGYVPAPYTDSIFALLGEELGLVGTWTVIALFLALCYRGFRISARANSSFGQILGAGLTFWLIFQAFANIAVVTATIPFTGVPLPFISFGGSSLVAALGAVGVLLSISRAEAEPTKEANATLDLGRRNGGPRLPSPGRHRASMETVARPVRPRGR
ncbi:MAG: putative lipid II flippase FtsW [Chloroflexi bacterium]|nr:putative lipid II flippase FtsW [Chloroflexota bacterium]